MNGKEVVMKLRIDTILGDMNKVVSGLQNGLTKGVSKIDVGSSIEKSLTKNIQQFREEYNKFSQLTAGGTSVKFSNSKEAISSGEKLVKLYRDLQAQVTSIGELSTAKLKKLFPDSFDTRIDSVTKGLVQMHNAMLNLNTKEAAFDEATASAQQYEQRLTALRGQLEQTTAKEQELEAAKKAAGAAAASEDAAIQELEKVKSQVEQTKTSFEDLKKQFADKINLNIDTVTKEINTLDKEIDELIAKRDKLTKGGDAAGASKVQKEIDTKTSTKRAKEREQSTLITASAKASGAKTTKALMEQAKYAGSNAQEKQASLNKAQQLAAQQTKQAQDQVAAEQQVAQAKEKTAQATERQTKAQQELDNANKNNKNVTAEIERTTKEYEKAANRAKELGNEIANIKTKMSTAGLADLKQLIPNFDEAKLKTTEGVQEIIAQLQTMDDQRAEKVRQELLKLGETGKQTEAKVEGLKNGLRGIGEGTQAINQANQDLNMLKSRLQYFFGLTNSVMLFKRAVTSALNTVKELDATMTETAVVTEFDIGDMWEQLPKYSKEAQALGVSINGMYQATTLYYQQGLKTNAAMELGVETMKMAKIAGIESADATKAMTAALRGFNMELNETSATRVNDVYSQLAAVTAADTKQIATAMEKTASIAASANMEFETTAALLAQIIETTQEAPETAGTAMKTIIARFAEVKSLREQGLTTGKDEEGEEINVNNIQKALRSVGISMEGFFSGSEGLDSVLLKLAEKWKGLDFETQRYIATMAAGSRQQSRFIAMMSDYGRTTELVGQAQNSAGASQKQFEKTQESLDTSLTRLKNTWQEFLMGLANNEVLKGAIDSLTRILETVNKLTGSSKGLGKSISSLVTVLATLKIGRTLIGGTAVGAGIGGLVKNMIGGGGAGGEGVAQKSSRFSVAQGFYERPGLSTKQIMQESYHAKRTEIKANRIPLGQRIKGTFTKESPIDQGELKHRIRASAKTAATPEEANKFHAIDKQLKKGMITTEEASKKYEELGGKVTKTSLDFQSMGKAVSGAGMAMMAAGAATSLLSSLFSSLGMEEEAEAVQKVSGVLMGLGSVLMMIGSFLPVLTTLTAAQAAATWAAMWPVLLIMAALIALIAIIILIKKALDKASLEGRMKAAAEATENAKKAAEEAKEAYDKLLEAKSGYDELQNKLDELTKGTLEWKEALAESNAQVLELLSTYPILAQYLTRGRHGELEITDEGWDKVLEQQAQAVKNANANVVASQMEETRLAQEKADQTVQKHFIAKDAHYDYEHGIWYGLEEGDKTVNGVDGTYAYEEDTINSLLEKYRSDPELFKKVGDSYSDALEAIAAESDYTAEELWNMKDAIAEYDQALVNNEKILQAQSEALLSSQVSDDTMQYKYSKELIAGMGAGLAKNQAKREDDIAKKLYSSDGKSESKNNEYFKQIAKENGLTENNFTGKDKDDLEILYAKMAGITRDQIADGLKGNKDKLAQEIAKMQAAKDAGKETDQIYKAMSKLNEETQRNYAVLMSKDVSNANQAFIAKFKEGMSPEEIREMAGKLGFSDTKDAEGNVTETAEEKMAKSYGYEATVDVNGNVITTAVENMQRGFKQVAITAEQEFEKITKNANSHNIDLNKKHLQQMTKAQLDSYVNLLSLTSSEETKNALQSGFDELFEGATDEQKAKISSLLETFDWTKEGAGEDFIAAVKEMGVEVDWTAANFQEFAQELKLVNAAFRTFSLSEFVKKMEDGYKEAMEIAEADSLTTEQYEKYLKDGLIKEGEWEFNGEGWVNVTNGMVELVDALLENTKAIYATEQLEARRQLDDYEAKKQEIGQKLIKVTSYTGGGTFLTSSSNLNNQGSGSAVSTNQEDIIKHLVYSDNVAESVWKQVFGSQEEYDNFKRMYKGGADQASKFLEQAINIDPDSIQKKIEKSMLADPYDKYYSVYERLEGVARKREQLENEYNRLLKKGNIKKAAEINQQRLQTLASEKSQYLALQLDLEDEQDTLIKDLNNKIKGANVKVGANGEITFNENVVNNRSGQTREEFDTLFEQLKDVNGKLNDANTRLSEIDNEANDYEDEDRESYIDAITKVRDALVSEREKEIAELQNINSSINDTNSKILESMQEQLADARQARENEKTEQELEDKQRRLAYLQQDTSGANAQEILELQKEIEEGQESYTDQLIDQKISELQKQNDLAAEQRQHQIEILEEQKRLMEEGGAWNQAEKLFRDAFSTGELNMNSKLVTLLKEADGYDQMSTEEKKKWEKDITVSLGAGYVFTKTKYLKYATGGLADFTGPAWLDGTKSRPEYVLNARQTEAFFTLVDVLSGMGLGGSTTTQNSGDNTYDIDINVESIGSDYDVERIADKVKTLIVNDSRYRNNNVLK